jgi:N-acetylglucosaminyldiphosphoundecaprenol N-acetyl-beta-D-mannosaminyltransferase
MSKDTIRTVGLLGYKISACKTNDITSVAFAMSRGTGKSSYMACANPHSLVVANTDLHFQAALKGADILIPDGAGIVLAAKLLNLPLHFRVAGSEFFISLSELAEKQGGVKYFFLGSTTDNLARIAERLKNEFPAIEICGTYSPPYKDEFNEQDHEIMINLINKAKPDVLWVGMTAPKQEKWIYQHRDKLFVPFIAAIGAVFDYYAGTKKRASPVWQRLGLEWLPRLLREPGRVWRRMFVSAPVFVYWVLKEKAGKALHEEV